MATTICKNSRIAAIATCVPARQFDNLTDMTAFSADEVRKVVGMAGVNLRHLADETICSSDLCVKAAEQILERLNWLPESVDALILVTQTPDYFLPSTSCVIHKRLALSTHCAAFDVGLGCSGYPYGLWLAAMMVSHGLRRILVLHGETPSRFSDASDRSVSLLFGDAGSATAVEAVGDQAKATPWHFVLNSDGEGYQDMIIESGGFRDRFGTDKSKHCVRMKGANIFNFTIKRVPSLIEETLALAGCSKDDIDYFILHQSNRFIIMHLIKKMGLPPDKVPLILKDYGNTGGASIPLTITQGQLCLTDKPFVSMMMLGYGVGLSWSSALITLASDVILNHCELESLG